MRRVVPLLALLTASPAWADPGTLPVQGELSDADGTPIDQSLPVSFTLYADDLGSTVLWSETRTVDFDLGAFTVMLGQEEVLDLAIFRDEPNVWLGIAIDGGEEMDLIALGSAPYAGYAQYAGRAMDAESVGGLYPEDLRQTGEAVSWTDLADVPEGLADGDADTTYTAGTGLSLSGTEFIADSAWVRSEAEAVCYDSVGELTADLDSYYDYSAGTGLTLSSNTFSVDDSAIKPDWSNVTGIPTGFADNIDDDTTYTAGTGIVITGTTVSTNSSYVQSEARKAVDATHIRSVYTPGWSEIGSMPAGFRDGTDDDTTYTAGAGLSLSSGSFTVDTSYLGSLYRGSTDAIPWADLSGVPADLADGDDVGVLAADLAAEIGKLSTLDLPAGTTIGGESLPEARLSSPVIQFGSTQAAPIASHYGGIIDFPRHFTKSPAWALGIDESINNSGASWCHGRRRGINRAWYRCNSTTDALYWMAMEPGRHTIDGKEVEAGTAASVRNKDTIFFSKTFSKKPVVILMAGWYNEHWRVIGSSGATTGGFQVGGLNRNGYPMHWIALEPGDYEYNGYHFEVGVVSAPSNGKSYKFSGSFDAIPNMYFTMWDTNDSGGVYVRTREISETGFTVYTNSASEYLYYVAVEEVQ